MVALVPVAGPVPAIQMVDKIALDEDCLLTLLSFEEIHLFLQPAFLLLQSSADPRRAQPPPYMVVSPEAMASSICCGQIQCTSASPSPRPTTIPVHSSASFLNPRCVENNLQRADCTSKLVAGEPPKQFQHYNPAELSAI